jgi:hypothetical protein
MKSGSRLTRYGSWLVAALFIEATDTTWRLALTFSKAQGDSWIWTAC